MNEDYETENYNPFAPPKPAPKANAKPVIKPLSYTPPTPPSIGLVPEGLLEKIGTYILEGLNEKEAAVLAGLTYSEIEVLSANDQYSLYIEKVKIKFKHQHMKRISETGDGKTSQWLIDRNTPKDEKAKVLNPIALIIREVQMSTDSPVVIHEIDAKEKHIEKVIPQRLDGKKDATKAQPFPNSII